MTTERGGTRQGELSIGDTDVPAEGWVRDLITKVATQCLQESSDILIHIAQTVVQIAEKRLQSQLDDFQSQIKAQERTSTTESNTFSAKILQYAFTFIAYH